MHNPFVELILVLVALYVHELAAWCPPPRRLLTQRLGGFGLHFPGWGWRSPVPWLISFDLDGFRVFPTEAGLFAYQPHRVTVARPPGWGRRLLRVDEAAKLGVQGGELRWRDQPLLNLPTGGLAESLARWIQQWAAAPDLAPGDALAPCLDVAAARRRVDEILRLTRPLRIAQSVLLTYVAVAAARLATGAFLFGSWQPLLIGLGVLLLPVLVLFYLAHRRVQPEALGDRIEGLLVMLLAFPAATRAADRVTRHALAEFHWATVLLAVGAETEAGSALREELRLLHLRRGAAGDDDPLARVEAEVAARTAELLSAFGAEHGIDLGEWAARPEHPTPGAVVCPLCGSEYVPGTTRCAECDRELGE